MIRGKHVAVVSVAVMAVSVGASPANASDGSYAGGVVTVNATPGETDVNFSITAPIFAPGKQSLSIASYRTELIFSAAGVTCDVYGSGPYCPDAPVSAVNVNGGAGDASITVGTDAPATVSVVSGATSGLVDVYGPGVVAGVTGGAGNDDINLGDGEGTMGAGSVTSGTGDDSVSYDSVGGGLVAADLGPGIDSATLAGSLQGSTVLLGDDNDEFTSYATTVSPISVDGGAGEDTINFMNGPVRASGGPGKDVFEPDKNQTPPLSGGLPAVPSPGDVLRGGPGKDTVRLDSPGRTKKVRISLDGKANDGQSGEKDNYGKDIENVWVRYVTALVTGSKARNVIELLDGGTIRGLGGNDHLIGGSVLIGGPGRDRLDGGADTRKILAVDGQRDRITCGEGAESVYADRTDVVEKKGCARIVRR